MVCGFWERQLISHKIPPLQQHHYAPLWTPWVMPAISSQHWATLITSICYFAILLMLAA
jgi:hypothetical protein